MDFVTLFLKKLRKLVLKEPEKSNLLNLILHAILVLQKLITSIKSVFIRSKLWPPKNRPAMF